MSDLNLSLKSLSQDFCKQFNFKLSDPSSQFKKIEIQINQIESQFMELTNLANTSGSNVNFDSLGKVLSITQKVHDTTSASIYEIILKIWEKYDCN
jgi:hypothetical protein